MSNKIKQMLSDYNVLAAEKLIIEYESILDNPEHIEKYFKDNKYEFFNGRIYLAVLTNFGKRSCGLCVEATMLAYQHPDKTSKCDYCIYTWKKKERLEKSQAPCQVEEYCGYWDVAKAINAKDFIEALKDRVAIIKYVLEQLKKEYI